jgi:hypothetical protein
MAIMTARPEPFVREPASWIPEQYSLTDAYPVFPSHVIAFPDGHAPWFDVGGVVNRACRGVAVSRRQVTGGLPRKPAPPAAIETTNECRDVRCMLSAFGPDSSSSAYDLVANVLDQYPKNDGTDMLRAALDAIQRTNCQACATEFDVRTPHACSSQGLATQRRAVAAVDAILRDLDGAGLARN